MSILNLFKPSYWFSQPLIAHGLTLWIPLGACLFFIVGGLILKIAVQYCKNKASKIILKRTSNLAIVLGFFGVLWIFFRQERAIILAWRAWLLVLAVLFIWRACKIVRYAVKRLPEIKEEQERTEKLNKYLPKSR